MIIQFENNIKESDRTNILNKIAEINYKTTVVKTQVGEYLVGTGKKEFDIRSFGNMPGIADIHMVSDDFQLVSRKWKINPTVINLNGNLSIGEGHFAVMAGPCSIENEQQIRLTIEHLKSQGIRIMRGGVYKPRSSPYSFRGLGIDGLKLWHQIAKENDMHIVTEVMQVSQIAEMYDYVDIFQVGARNTQNFNLLDELGKVDKPVLLKRGISGTIEELLSSAEYIFSGGNEALILCERGIRTYETASRNTLDLNAIPILKEKTHLPVVVDPSHGIGIRSHVEPMALAAIMAGADGIIYETHQKPEEAFSDGQQTLDFDESKRLNDRMKKVLDVKNSL